jgi:hypothetical protein
MTARLWPIALFTACTVSATTARASDPTEQLLPIVFHVAALADGQPVVSEEFLTVQLARANAIFAPYGVRFADSGRMPLASAHAALETRQDRDVLGRHARRGAIDCFVVASLRDVDEPERMRQGVHWRSRSHRGSHFIVLSSAAGRDVLAHELGHYLGNPGHADGPDNLMSYARTRPDPILDDGQLARMRAAIARYLRSGELRPAKRAERHRAEGQKND